MTGSRPARVGLFGGTFDPPHIGHVTVAADVADRLDLDTVLWVPAREPPHKPMGAHAPAGLRLEMVRCAVAADPRFEVSALELEREGPSYTIDTVRTLRASYPEAEIFLIVGVDQFKALTGWRQPAELVRLVRLAVMDRGGESAQSFVGEVPGCDEAIFVPVTRVDVSATAVRSALRRGMDVSTWLPPGVEAIIEREGLYSTDDARPRGRRDTEG